MPKVVAIQRNLESIGRKLEARGYEVVDEAYEGYIDALLYHSDYGNLGYLDNFDNVIDMDRGAIVVNAKDKSIDDIIHTIEGRVYESFY